MAQDQLDAAALDSWVRAFAGLVAENRELLTELDAAIGDADHGTNMDRGMKAVLAALDESRPTTPKALLTKVGMTLVSTVGGASGPLFGTFFLRMGTALGDGESVPRQRPRAGAESRAGRRGPAGQGGPGGQDDGGRS